MSLYDILKEYFIGNAQWLTLGLTKTWGNIDQINPITHNSVYE